MQEFLKKHNSKFRARRRAHSDSCLLDVTHLHHKAPPGYLLEGMGDWRTMEEKGKERDQEMRLEAGGRGTGTVGGVFWSDFVFVCDRTEAMSHSRAQLSSYSLLMP